MGNVEQGQGLRRSVTHEAPREARLAVIDPEIPRAALPGAHQRVRAGYVLGVEGDGLVEESTVGADRFPGIGGIHRHAGVTGAARIDRNGLRHGGKAAGGARLASGHGPVVVRPPLACLAAGVAVRARGSAL